MHFFVPLISFSKKKKSPDLSAGIIKGLDKGRWSLWSWPDCFCAAQSKHSQRSTLISGTATLVHPAETTVGDNSFAVEFNSLPYSLKPIRHKILALHIGHMVKWHCLTYNMKVSELGMLVKKNHIFWVQMLMQTEIWLALVLVFLLNAWRLLVSLG